MALGGRVIHRVHVNGIVGAGLHAGLATDAPVVVDVHDAVGPLMHGPGGTDIDARGLGAVIAAQDSKMTPGRGETSDFNVLDPGAEDAQRDVVFGFASRGAGVASDAARLVDD